MKAAVYSLVVCGSVIAAGCGQKGPLYLPDKNAAVVTRPAGSGAAPPNQSAPAPTPAPQGTSLKPEQDKDKDKNKDESQSNPSSTPPPK